MTERTYHADTMANVLGDVKHDLGRDAVILKTRSYRKGAFMGLVGGKPMWEITACAAADLSRNEEQGKYVSETPLEQTEKTLQSKPRVRTRPVLQSHAADALEQLAASAPGGNADSAHLAGEVADLKQMVTTLLEQGDLTDSPAIGPLGELYANLLAQDVDVSIAKELIASLKADLTGAQLRDESLVRQELCNRIAAKIDTVDPAEQVGKNSRQCRVIALIGPTGVGKTTTIAKLAANYKLRQGLRVGMITIDTYRVAAVDQLQTYAEIVESQIGQGAVA